MTTGICNSLRLYKAFLVSFSSLFDGPACKYNVLVPSHRFVTAACSREVLNTHLLSTKQQTQIEGSTMEHFSIQRATYFPPELPQD